MIDKQEVLNAIHTLKELDSVLLKDTDYIVHVMRTYDIIENAVNLIKEENEDD